MFLDGAPTLFYTHVVQSRSPDFCGGESPGKLYLRGRSGEVRRAPFQEPGLKDPEVQKSYYNVVVGLIAGNVYLLAASQGLAAWFHNCNKPELSAVLKLRPEQRVLFA